MSSVCFSGHGYQFPLGRLLPVLAFVCAQVFPELNAVLEVLPQTDDTDEHVGVVLLAVAAQGGQVSEGLGTEVTGVGPLTCVLHDVTLECIPGVKGLPAALAPEGLLAGVCPLMADESHNLGEGPATV